MAATSNPRFLAELDGKLSWAETYLDRFQSAVTAWESSKPYTVSKQDDALHGRCVRRLHTKPLHFSIPLLLSDFIYNLRSSLDHLAWQLSVLGSTYPTEKDARVIAFPIHDSTDHNSIDLFNRQVKYMPSDAVEILRDLQPYKRGNAYRDDPLWQLNKLWNIDKHRTIAMNGGHSFDIFAGPPGFATTVFDDRIEFYWPFFAKSEIVFKPLVARLELGDPVDTPGDAFNIGKERVTAIHRHVRRTVVPKLAGFFT